jgi:hypothetical protein
MEVLLLEAGMRKEEGVREREGLVLVFFYGLGQPCKPTSYPVPQALTSGRKEEANMYINSCSVCQREVPQGIDYLNLVVFISG